MFTIKEGYKLTEVIWLYQIAAPFEKEKSKFVQVM